MGKIVFKTIILYICVCVRKGEYTESKWHVLVIYYFKGAEMFMPSSEIGHITDLSFYKPVGTDLLTI